MRKCKNCEDTVDIRDEREGLIHIRTGRYGCQRKKTVAE